jgi:hypothetical protein
MRKKKRTSSEIERTGYHEAGHAVAHYSFRETFHHVIMFSGASGAGKRLMPGMTIERNIEYSAASLCFWPGLRLRRNLRGE